MASPGWLRVSADVSVTVTNIGSILSMALRMVSCRSLKENVAVSTHAPTHLRTELRNVCAKNLPNQTQEPQTNRQTWELSPALQRAFIQESLTIYSLGFGAGVGGFRPSGSEGLWQTSCEHGAAQDQAGG
eukprot:4344679-Amphidinium_carterae.1